jgi:hypothetical protein
MSSEFSNISPAQAPVFKGKPFPENIGIVFSPLLIG